MMRGTSDCIRPASFRGFRQTDHKRLDHIGQFGKRERKPRDDHADRVLFAEQGQPDDAFNNSHIMNAVKEDFLGVMRINKFNHVLAPEVAQ